MSISAFTGPDAAVQTELTIDLLIGALIVIATTALWPTGMGPWGRSDASTLEPGGVDDTGFVLVYAATFAIVLGIALYLGMQIFTAGAIWVANGAFMILGPSTNQSFVHAIERAAAAVVGTVIGLTAVGLISSDVVLIVLWGLFAFVALGSLNAGYFVMVGAYTAGMTMTWAVQGQDVSTLNSTNRVLAEGIALVIVLIAVAFLKWWAKHRRVTGHVEAELAS